jgi:hypothetical protein
MRVRRHLRRDPQTVTSTLQPHVRRIREMDAERELSKTNYFAIALVALAAALSMMPRQIFAQGAPVQVFTFNADPELSAGAAPVVVANSAPIGFAAGTTHKLIIDYSSVGAISADLPGDANRALLYIGCDIIDGTGVIAPCIGTQNDPAGVPAGWVNVLSCDFPACAAWDNSVSHVWFSHILAAAPGPYTVRIRAEVGFALLGPPIAPGKGGPGTLFDEARNLVVTVLNCPAGGSC